VQVLALVTSQCALFGDQTALVAKKRIRLFTASSRQGKRHRRGIDARAISFSTRTDPFGFL
jgi:hypothetical protein